MLEKLNTKTRLWLEKNYAENYLISYDTIVRISVIPQDSRNMERNIPILVATEMVENGLLQLAQPDRDTFKKFDSEGLPLFTGVCLYQLKPEVIKELNKSKETGLSVGTFAYVRPYLFSKFYLRFSEEGEIVGGEQIRRESNVLSREFVEIMNTLNKQGYICSQQISDKPYFRFTKEYEDLCLAQVPTTKKFNTLTKMQKEVVQMYIDLSNGNTLVFAYHKPKNLYVAMNYKTGKVYYTINPRTFASLHKKRIIGEVSPDTKLLNAGFVKLYNLDYSNI